MRRASKILCGFGAAEFLLACLALYVFEHMPFPWGAGTLPGGLSDANAPDPWEKIMDYQARFICAAFGAGFVGCVYFAVGSLGYIVSKLLPPHSRPAT